MISYSSSSCEPVFSSQHQHQMLQVLDDDVLVDEEWATVWTMYMCSVVVVMVLVIRIMMVVVVVVVLGAGKRLKLWLHLMKVMNVVLMVVVMVKKVDGTITTTTCSRMGGQVDRWTIVHLLLLLLRLLWLLCASQLLLLLISVVVMVIVDDNLVVGITILLLLLHVIIRPSSPIPDSTVGRLVLDRLIGGAVVVVSRTTGVLRRHRQRLHNLIGGVAALAVIEDDCFVAVAVVV